MPEEGLVNRTKKKRSSSRDTTASCPGDELLRDDVHALLSGRLAIAEPLEAVVQLVICEGARSLRLSRAHAARASRPAEKREKASALEVTHASTECIMRRAPKA